MALSAVLPSHAPAAIPAASETRSSGALLETVITIVAEVTRYPREILKPQARLEEDLGIDSVKRAEIVAVLGARLELPATSSAPATPVRTIEDLVRAVESYLVLPPAAGDAGAALAAVDTGVPRDSVDAVSPPPATRPAPGAPASPVATKDRSFAESVIGLIADFTRYPRQILQPAADLEEDLGFDAVQQAAVLDAVRRGLGRPVAEDRPPASVRTIGDIVAVLERETANAADRPLPTSTSRSSAAVQSGPQSNGSSPFSGKVALVTGSGHGLGRVIVRQLASLGATVIVNSFHSRERGAQTAAEIVEAGGQALHLWGSVANPAHLQQIFEQIDDRFGALDFFVSNASNGVLARLKDVEPEHWDRALRTNVVALHQGALLAAELMRRRGGGKIVAVSSSGSQRYLDYFGCMGPIKAAVECLVRYLAIELGADGIQVNAVSAGPIYGELLDKYPDYDRLRGLWEAVVPRQRLNDEAEAADAVLFLLTNSGMNGTVLMLDAGGGQRIAAPLSS
jgi:NAD(P)-dependent dehydrogenase (short-subunit alcohol dehydrogenase family)/acyl carrier protein